MTGGGGLVKSGHMGMQGRGGPVEKKQASSNSNFHKNFRSLIS